MWWSEDTSGESLLFFHRIGLRNWIEVTRLVNKCHSPNYLLATVCRLLDIFTIPFPRITCCLSRKQCWMPVSLPGLDFSLLNSVSVFSKQVFRKYFVCVRTVSGNKSSQLSTEVEFVFVWSLILKPSRLSVLYGHLVTSHTVHWTRMRHRILTRPTGTRVQWHRVTKDILDILTWATLFFWNSLIEKTFPDTNRRLKGEF